MRKWLLVLDQVGYDPFDSMLRTFGNQVGWGPYPLVLDYIPRTTPVGHATISTGLLPKEHRIQGRVWFSRGSSAAHRVEALPETVPTPTVFDPLRRNSLARRLRQDPTHRDAAIVAAAAKNFIPFLFGAWDTDVSVYPRTTSPERDSSGYSIDIIFDAFSMRGDAAVVASESEVLSLAYGLVDSNWSLNWVTPAKSSFGPGHRRHMMRWQVPARWGKSRSKVRESWRHFLEQSIVAVDEFYTNVIERLLAAMRPLPGGAAEIALQSCVATDSYGHWHGPSSLQYVRALGAGITRAIRLAGQASVMVTSDHGGRDTPAWWKWQAGSNGNAASITTGGELTSLPPADFVLEGDHLVGYSQNGAVNPTEHGVRGGMLVPVQNVPRSYHPDQVPSWIVLPDIDSAIMDLRQVGNGGGGAHGACEDGGTLSPVDGRVPLWVLANATPSTIPSGLEGVAAAFLALR
ncbi:MAG TPA: alkaline phosphatase family protein [Kofleriaceae bacterium]|nr:alkaline phosphatase family protein [Kofleriaceae bacterium]